MSTIPAKAAQVLAEGRVTADRSTRVYKVESPPVIYRVKVVDGIPSCPCYAGINGNDCHHAYAVRMLEAETTARARAWADAEAALRNLFAIVEDEDVGPDGDGGDEATRTALLEALDGFDLALSIDRGRGLVPPKIPCVPYSMAGPRPKRPTNRPSSRSIRATASETTTSSQPRRSDMPQLQKGAVPLPEGVPEQRAEVFMRLRDHIESYECRECLGHDNSRPGGDPHGRFAVHAQGDGGHSELTRASSLARCEDIAISHIRDGWAIVAAYDLDTLSGPEPRPDEGDKVKLTNEGRERCGESDDTFYVVGTETDTFDGEAYEKLYLSRNKDAGYLGGDYDVKIDEAYVTIIEPATPEERLPVKHSIAAQRIIVVFNTVAG